MIRVSSIPVQPLDLAAGVVSAVGSAAGTGTATGIGTGAGAGTEAGGAGVSAGGAGVVTGSGVGTAVVTTLASVDETGVDVFITRYQRGVRLFRRKKLTLRGLTIFIPRFDLVMLGSVPRKRSMKLGLRGLLAFPRGVDMADISVSRLVLWSGDVEDEVEGS